MAKGITLSNSRQEFGHLVLGGVFSSDLGHCVREVNLVKTATMKIGSILKADNTEAAKAEAADAAKVLIWTDALFGIDDVAVGDTFTAVVGVRDLTLNRFAVYYKDGFLVDDAGVAALETHDLKLTEKVVFTS